jgi:hypothetical protein
VAIATAQQRENLAAAYAAAATYASLHTADPGANGANEVTGTGYARQAITWTGGAVDGVTTASVTFTVPANVSVTHAGLQTAGTGGTYLDRVAAVYNAQPQSGTLTVNLTYTQS